MSDGFNPSIGSVLEAGRSVVNLGLTIADRLQAADDFTQTAQAQSQILDQMRKFDDSMTTDPDWRTWRERANKAYSDAFQSILPNVKSNKAKQDLQPWFLEQRANQLDKVSQKYNQRLVGE